MLLSRILHIGFLPLLAFSLMSVQPQAIAADSAKELGPRMTQALQAHPSSLPSWFDLSLLELHLLHNINLMHQEQHYMGQKENSLEAPSQPNSQWLRHIQRQDATSPGPSQTQDIPSAQ